MTEDDEPPPTERRCIELDLTRTQRKIALKSKWKTCLACKYADYDGNGQVYLNDCSVQDNGQYGLRIGCSVWRRGS